MSDFETVPVGTTVELERIKQERDALAAYQEELVRELTACQSVLHNLAHDGQVTPEYASDAKAVLKRKPTASLARHDAKVAYDAVYTSAVILNGVEASEHLVELRKKAEGHQ